MGRISVLEDSPYFQNFTESVSQLKTHPRQGNVINLRQLTFLLEAIHFDG